MNQDNRGTDIAMRIYIQHSILSAGSCQRPSHMNMGDYLVAAQTGPLGTGLNAISHILWGRQAARRKFWSISNAVFPGTLHQSITSPMQEGRFRTQRHGFYLYSFFTGTD